jgi:septum formation protein
MTRLILASSSATRARMLTAAGVRFEVIPASVDEDSVKDSMLREGAAPRAIADALAQLKAVRVSAAYPQALVLGADLVLEFEGALVSKSASLAEAAALLCRLRGQTHHLFCAAVLAKAGQPVWRHLTHAKLRMREFSDAVLDGYLAAKGEDILSGVGCYRIEDEGIQFFDSIEGDYFSILGLPLLPLLCALREFESMPR